MPPESDGPERRPMPRKPRPCVAHSDSLAVLIIPARVERVAVSWDMKPPR
jgi:hypothetical protein